MQDTTKNEFVNATCLDGLEILKGHNLVFLATPAYDIFASACGNGELVDGIEEEESKETYSSIELLSSWSDKVRFDEEGFVVSLDLGGRRLYKGLPFAPTVFGQFSRLSTLSLAGTDLPLADILAILPHDAKWSARTEESIRRKWSFRRCQMRHESNLGVEAATTTTSRTLRTKKNEKFDLKYDNPNPGCARYSRAPSPFFLRFHL